MKKVIVFMLAALLIVCATSCGIIREATKEAEITDANNNITGKSFYEDDKLVKEEHYNNDGSLDHVDEYDGDGNVTKTTTSLYNDDGKLANNFIKTYKGDKLVEEQTISYDEDGNVRAETITSYTYNDDDSILKTVTTNGETKSEELIDKDGSNIYSLSYSGDVGLKSYYNDGLIDKTETYDADGNMTGYSTSTFNSNGSTKETITYRADGTVVLKSVYEYDGNKLSKVTMYDANGDLYRTNVYSSDGTITMYDADGNVIQ